MQLHLMGHVHLSTQGRSLPVSTKAAALLTYLCLEGRAHHREHLAELLWDTPDPLRNLRVELARLKRDGVANFPDRQPMLSFQCPLDLTAWLAASADVSEADLMPWLGTLRGLPLSGLEDLGSRRFQQWLEAQRWTIGEQIERTLATVQRRFMAQHHPGAAGHVQVRADQLGLRLSLPEEPAARPAPQEAGGTGRQAISTRVQEQLWVQEHQSPDGQAAEWQVIWEERAQLMRVLHRAETQPQLVLLQGRTGSGKRSLIRQSVQGSNRQGSGGWQAISLQASAQRPLFLEALSRQLALLLPAGQAAGSDDSTVGTDDRLIRLASTLHRSGLRVVVVVQNAALGLAWLPDLARFLLDLPLPLVLVLSESLPAAYETLLGGLGFVEPARCLHLQMPALSPRMVMQAWQGSPGVSDSDRSDPDRSDAAHTAPDHDVTRATLLVQRSEGWPLHIQALYRQPGRSELPDAVRAALLAEVAALPAVLRGALARLSLIHAPIGGEVAALLLGPEAQGLLLQGVQHEVLVQASASEVVRLPGLEYRSDDQTRALHFAGEALRVALAGSLTGIERQHLRALLAEHYLTERPALSLYYAGKAGLPELAARAREALSLAAGAPQPWRSSGAAPDWRRPLTGGAALATWPVPKAAATLSLAGQATPPDALPTFRREVRTANGYRVAIDSGRLEVLRCGWYGPAPRLVLPAGVGAGGSWSLTARLDVYRGTPELGGWDGGNATGPEGYALGLQIGGEPVQRWVPEGADEAPSGLGRLPLHTWFTLHGSAQAGPLELSVQALNLALTVADLRCGGKEMLPARF